MTFLGFAYVPVIVNDKGWKPGYRSELANAVAGKLLHGLLFTAGVVEDFSGGRVSLPVAFVEVSSELDRETSPGKPERPDVGLAA